MIGRAFQILGVSNATLEADLPKMVDIGRQKLYGFQHADGGWGWWFDDPSHDYQSAYILYGLAMTRQAGFAVDDGVIGRGADWLRQQLDGMDPRTRAYALYALATAWQGELGVAQTLASEVLAGQIEDFDPFSRAALALALHTGGDSATAELLVDQLTRSAVVEGDFAHWDTGISDGKYKNKTMASSVRSTALALDALVQLDPGNALIPKAVHWLMAQRQGRAWATTQETSYAMLALADYVLSAQSQVSQENYRIDVNGVTVGEGSFAGVAHSETVTVPGTQLKAGENVVRLLHGGDGRLYYSVWVRSYLEEQTLEPAGEIVVERHYTRPRGKPFDEPLRLGDVVEVHLTVTMPEDGSYVIVYDPLPAGLEGINDRLATTSYVARERWESELEPRKYPYSRKDVRDEAVALFINELPAGTHTFTYLARATTAGTFHALPSEAYPMYRPELWGRSAGDVVQIRP
jgi:uncharacterized protein YfaS (alpha-2-macroglobulin family)